MPTTAPPALRQIPAAFLLLLAIVAWFHPLDDVAVAQVDTGLKRALATFAIARTANGVISALQETTVSVGIVSAQPAQLLDPINDLVEQFSTLMLAASVSFGVQRVLIAIAGAWPVAAALGICAIAWAALRWRTGDAPRWIGALLAFLLFLRFAVPVAALASEATFRVFMAQGYEESVAQVKLTSEAVKQLNPAAEEAPRAGFLDRIRGLADLPDQWRQKLAEIQAKLDGAVDHIVRLVAIFTIQTILLPLFFLWAAQRAMRAIVAWPSVAATPGDRG